MEDGHVDTALHDCVAVWCSLFYSGPFTSYWFSHETFPYNCCRPSSSGRFPRSDGVETGPWSTSRSLVTEPPIVH